jgi:hypothetical protein
MGTVVLVVSLLAGGATITNSSLMRKGAVAIVHVFKHPKPAEVKTAEPNCDSRCLAAMQEPADETPAPEVVGVEEPGQSEPSVD